MSKKLIKPVLLLLFIILAIYIGKVYAPSDIFTKEYIEGVVTSFGVWAPLIFIGIYVLVTVFFLPGLPFTVAAGFIFGAVFGTIYTVIGATIGATIAFLISRFLGKDFVDKILKNKFSGLYKYDEKLQENGLITMLFLRLVPLFPFNGLNFALGLTKIRFKDYLLGTAVGIIPGSFVYAYGGSILAIIGNSDNIVMEVIQDPIFYIFLVVFIILIIIPIVYKRLSHASTTS